jgi:hypothetical protein
MLIAWLLGTVRCPVGVHHVHDLIGKKASLSDGFDPVLSAEYRWKKGHYVAYNGKRDGQWFSNPVASAFDVLRGQVGVIPQHEHSYVHHSINGSVLVGSFNRLQEPTAFVTRDGKTFSSYPNPSYTSNRFRFMSGHFVADKNVAFNGIGQIDLLTALAILREAYGGYHESLVTSHANRDCHASFGDLRFGMTGDGVWFSCRHTVRWYMQGNHYPSTSYCDAVHDVRYDIFSKPKNSSLPFTLATEGAYYSITSDRFQTLVTETSKVVSLINGDGSDAYAFYGVYPGLETVTTTDVTSLSKYAWSAVSNGDTPGLSAATPQEFIGHVWGLNSSHIHPFTEAYLYDKYRADLPHLVCSAFHASSEALDGYLNEVESNYLETFLELGEWLTVIRSVVKVWKFLTHMRKDPLQAGRDLVDICSDAELLLRFGILPASQDAQNLLQTANQITRVVRKLAHATEPKTLYGRKTFVLDTTEYGFNDVTLTTNSKLVVGLPADQFAQLWLGLDAMGTAPTLSRVWDVVPMSFVVDWAFAIGGRLDAIDRQLKTLFVRCFYSIHSFAIDLPIDDQTQRVWGLTPCPSSEGYGARIRLYGRFTSRILPSLRNSTRYDFGAPTGDPNLGIVGALAWKVVSA